MFDYSDYPQILCGSILFGAGGIALLVAMVATGPMDLIRTMLVVAAILIVVGAGVIITGWRKRLSRYRRWGLIKPRKR